MLCLVRECDQIHKGLQTWLEEGQQLVEVDGSGTG